MRELQPLGIVRLSVLEFGQHIKSISKNIGLLGANFITDVPFKNYIAQLNSESENYDKAMLQVTKSDETAKITAADALRDNALTASQRFLAVFELCENEAEKLAYDSLYTLFNTYKGIQKWNFEEESNGIDNLVKDLQNDKYKPHVTLLGMSAYITRIENRNNDFKTLFAARTQESVGKEVYNVLGMRKGLKTINDDMNSYVLSMAKISNTPQYNDTLDVINAVRKYYHDLLAKRKPSATNTPPTPIPPMG
jgi:hypothetical protein